MSKTSWWGRAAEFPPWERLARSRESKTAEGSQAAVSAMLRMDCTPGPCEGAMKGFQQGSALIKPTLGDVDDQDAVRG